MLTQERLKEVLRYEDGEFTRIGPWYVRGLGKKSGTLHSSGYVYVSVDNNLYLRHRLVWLYFHGEFPKDQIDHINGIRNYDRVENLREATQSENSQNQRKAHRDSQTGILGVSRNGNGYAAQIGAKGVKRYLGTFPTEEEASEAHLAAKRKYHKFNTL